MLANMMNFAASLMTSYYQTGVAKVVETVMILFMVAWIIWCVKLMLEPDDLPAGEHED